MLPTGNLTTIAGSARVLKGPASGQIQDGSLDAG